MPGAGLEQRVRWEEQAGCPSMPEADERFGLYSPENKRLDAVNRHNFTCQEQVGGVCWDTHLSWEE